MGNRPSIGTIGLPLQTAPAWGPSARGSPVRLALRSWLSTAMVRHFSILPSLGRSAAVGGVIPGGNRSEV